MNCFFEVLRCDHTDVIMRIFVAVGQLASRNFSHKVLIFFPREIRISSFGTIAVYQYSRVTIVEKSNWLSDAYLCAFFGQLRQ